MMFVQSLHGISHNKIEDTKEEHLELAVRAFDRLASKAMEWIGRWLLGEGSARADWSPIRPVFFRVGFVVGVRAAQERHPIEHAFLEPFQREVNHRRDVERDQLRKIKPPTMTNPSGRREEPSAPNPKRDRQRAHQRGQRGHDDGAKTFHARFVDRAAPIVAFIEPMEREVDNHDAVLSSRCP